MLKMLTFSIAILLCGTLGWCADAAPASRPTEAVEWTSCVTAECHADIKSRPVAHGPINTDSCDACHEVYDVKEHTFRILRQGTDLCTYCHEFQTQGMPVVHEPVTRGECLGCHDPHGSSTRALTRENSEPELCGRCHESVTLDRAVLHEPVEQGQCVSCHPPHASKFPKLLDVMGADLCIACHADFETKMAGVKFRHKALEKGCTSCHDVHGSPHENVLVARPPDLCAECHEKVKEQALAATHKHGVVMEEESCLTCHAPHGSNHDRLMADASARICMDCHKDPIQQAGLNSLPQLTDPATIKHGPIRDGMCGGCHAAHGNDAPKLLTFGYEARLYQRFVPEKYELCFSCHDARLAANQQANDVTNFRNGDVNLHYVHINDPRKGRGCNVCHDPHAAKNDRGVRDFVQYGKQRLPIDFRRTETGGSCGWTCHPAHAYDRLSPVAQKKGQPTTRPVLAVPRATDEPMLAVNWIATDTAGKEIRIPNGAQPTLLLLMRPGDAANLTAARQLEVVLHDTKAGPVEVLLVSCGPQDDGGAEAISRLTPQTRPVIVDQANELCDALGVHSWPTTLLLDGAGVEIIRVGGAPESLAWKLDAYLNYATGRIDRAALDGQLAVVKPAQESEQEQLERVIRHAEFLLRQGNVQRASERIAEALKRHPNSLELRVLEVKALAGVGEAESTRRAMVLLERLPAGAVEEWERDLLRARLFCSLEQWDHARPAAQRLLSDRPDLVEAHYLMGRIHEAAGDFSSAAAEYRRAHELAGARKISGKD